MNNDAILKQIKTMDQEFIQLTGHQAYGYVSEPTPMRPRITFQDQTVCLSYPEALNYMTGLLATAKLGQDKLPYPFDQQLNAEQDLRTRK